jgi:CRP-like cAMP-binding protein
MHDKKKKMQRRSTAAASRQQIVPIAAVSGDDDNNNNDANNNTDAEKDMQHTSTTKSRVSSIHNEFDLHEEGLQKRMKKRQERAKRSTQLRLLARSRLKNSKALRKSTIFQKLDKEEIELLIDQMSYKKRYRGDILCKQDDVSDNFYVIVAGKAVVTILADNDVDVAENETGKVDGDDDDDGRAPAEIEVGHLSAFQFFGESALLASASDDELPQRTATVRVSSDKLELLCLHRSNYLRLMKSTVAQNMFQSKRDSVTSVEGGDGGEMCSESASVLERLKSVSDQRISENKLVMERLQRESSKKNKIVPLGRPKTDVVVVSSEPPIENDFSLSSRGDQDMGMV